MPLKARPFAWSQLQITVVLRPATRRGRLPWAGLLGLALLLAGWQLLAARLNPLVLPSPLETLAALRRLFAEGLALPALLITTRHALIGFAIALLLGGMAGTLAGQQRHLRQLIWPLASIVQSVPPIAWIVLALIWFGSGWLTVTLTVAAALLPLVFVSALEGARTVDPGLREMARAFQAPARLLLADVLLPHLLSYLFPAVIVGLGTAWKIALMAELLSGSAGIGEGLAVARVALDTPAAFAWIALAISIALSVEYLLLHPLKRRLEPWRHAPATGTTNIPS
jgi:NitT/TauT family transport system permease protein